MQARIMRKFVGLFVSLLLVSFATGSAVIPSELAPENQDLPCIDIYQSPYGCDSWCFQRNCGCTPGPGQDFCRDGEGRETGNSCNCNSRGEVRTCLFCPAGG